MSLASSSSSSSDKNDQMDEEQQASEDNYVEENKDKDPLIEASEWRWLLSLSESKLSAAARGEIKSKLDDRIASKNMAPFYELLVKQFNWTPDEVKLTNLKQANEKELSELNAKIEEAKANAGDSEVRESLLNRAHLYYRIGDKDEALAHYEETLNKTVGSSSQIDVIMAILRISFSFDDQKLIKKNLERAKNLVEKGGDWERKNLLRVYEALHLLQSRHFKEAASLLLESVATFTCYELCSYQEFVFYTVLASIVSVDRVTLREKVINSPEILSAIDSVPNLRSFLFSLYKSNYANFFSSLVAIVPQLSVDRYLSRHVSWYVREIRIVAYSQFLASYRSVTLSSMAQAFGISSEMLDGELFRFVSSGRVRAKIDKVTGRVETIRADAKNTHYQTLLKQGDSLLNRIQKLTKVITF